MKKNKIFFGIIFAFAYFLGGLYFATQFAWAVEENVYENTKVPIILGRETWENSYKLKSLLKLEPPILHQPDNKLTPNYYPVSRIIVHDIACNTHLPNGSRNPSCNSYNQNAVSLIQEIYRYHVVNKGLNDIGYNFIIDWQGKIYEGRYGGNAVVGEHTYDDSNCYNYNVGSIGILLLGNLAEERASLEMETSLIRLAAWLSMANDVGSLLMDSEEVIWQNERIYKQDIKTCERSEGKFSSEKINVAKFSFYNELTKEQRAVKLNMPKIRKETDALMTHYKEYHYQTTGLSETWVMTGGWRVREDKIGARVLAIKENQLYYFPELYVNKPKINDGIILRPRGRQNLFLVNGNLLQEIISETVFNSWNFSVQKIETIDWRWLEGFKKGEFLTYPSKTLLREQNDTKVYVVNEQGKLRHISSLGIFEAMGFSWKNVLEVSSREIALFEKIEPILYPTGTLIKGEADTVYLVTADHKKPIASYSLFLAHGFSFDEVKILPETELSLYKTGSQLLYPDNTILKDKDQEKNYLIKSGRKYLIARNLINYIKPQYSADLTKDNVSLSAYPFGGVVSETVQLEALLKQDKKATNFLSKDYDNLESPVISLCLGSFELETPLVIKGDRAYNVYKDEEVLPISQLEPENSFEVNFEASSAQKKLSLTSLDGSIIFSFKTNSENSIEKGYRGSLDFVKTEKGKYQIINHVFIEDYLRSLKLEEVAYVNEKEALQAIFIAQRSYLLSLSQDAQGCVLFARSRNLPHESALEEHNQIEATEQTRGVIMTYQDLPAHAIYSYDTCGVSRDARKVWGSYYRQFPYLWGGAMDPLTTIHYAKCHSLLDHGVGMSLAGANEFAKQGKSYFEILSHYYPFVSIKKIY